MARKQIVDCNNRVINYLRVSVTDRCNLSCMYCVGDSEFEFIPHENILRYEEILHLARLFVERGIEKIRVTGGEPLIRKGILDFLSRLSKLPGLSELTLTTNGVLLEEYASRLKECSVRRLNVSMDTLHREKFKLITGRDHFDRVWRGIYAAQKLGFDPIKINVVAMRGVNDDEILDFARLAVESPFHVRFIEFMPVGKNSPWSEQKFLPIDEIQRRIEAEIPLEVRASGVTEGPAQRFKPRGGQGEIGFIGAITRHFCASCNRLRLTASGKLRSCLLSDTEFDLITPLRSNQGDARLLKIMDEAVRHKAAHHRFKVDDSQPCGPLMVGIGG